MPEFNYLHGNKEYSINVTPDGDGGYLIDYNDRQYQVSAEKLKENFYSICMGEKMSEAKTYKAVVSKKNELSHVFIKGEIYQLSRSRGGRRTGAEDAGDLNSPITGKVVKVLVMEGDSVEKGQEIMVLEAMKMEYTITAPHGGPMEKINFNTGDQVQIGDELARIGATEQKEEE